MYQSYTFSNGVRLIHYPVNQDLARCCIMVNTGTRDELAHEHGIAHFIEHCLFKGTQKRKPFHIICRMENVGGDINAYTTKEETCVYTTFFNRDYDRAIELLSDIFFHSVFPEDEIEKEREVIIDEINSYRDNPSELIFDDFEDLVYQNHPIGRNILGTEESLKNIGRSEIIDFVRRTYTTDQIVIGSVGRIPFDRLVRLVDKYIKDIPASVRNYTRQKPNLFLPQNINIEKKTHQLHYVMGCLGYDQDDDRRTSLTLLNNMLGGPGLNSLLNLSLREKYGYAYTVDSNYTAYSDTGIVSIYLGTYREKLNKCLKLIDKELNKLKTVEFGKLQLQKSKRQLIGQIAMMFESAENHMLAFTKRFMHGNKILTYEDIVAEIEKIDSLEIMNITTELFDKEKITQLIYC